MHDDTRRYRPAVVLALVGVMVALAAGCVPLRNAPPGGGETVTQTFRYGPFVLGPGEEVQGFPNSGMPRPSGSFGLVGARFDAVDENGTPYGVHDVHLHHVVMTTNVRNDTICTGRRERFIASGMERTRLSLPTPYAYMVGADDQWGSIYHLMNESAPGTGDKTVYIQYTLDYKPGATAQNSRPVSVYFQDITGCGDSTYDVPGDGGPGSVHTNSRTWTAPNDGIAVYTGGHLHNGGIDITLRDMTQARDVCVGTATYHENPRHLSTINPCGLHHQVTSGHRYRVAARYENDQPWPDVMGIMMTYVWWGTQ
jgi:hypothetical protein